VGFLLAALIVLTIIYHIVKYNRRQTI